MDNIPKYWWMNNCFKQIRYIGQYRYKKSQGLRILNKC